MKAMHKEKVLPEFTQNDAVFRETLVRIYTIMWNSKQSPAHTIINKVKLDQLVLHLMAAPEFLLPTC